MVLGLGINLSIAGGVFVYKKPKVSHPGKEVEPLDDGSTVNTTSPILGVLDSEFRVPPKKGDRVFIGTVGGEPVNTLFTIADVQPDSHGGSKLILNRVKI